MIHQKGIEALTGGVAIIDTDHQYIHKGWAYELIGSFPAATSDAAISFTAPSLTAASRTIDTGDTDMIYTANRKGTVGNDITVHHVDPSGNNQNLKITVTGLDIVISLATGAAGAITTTAAQAIAAVNDHPEAGYLVTASTLGTTTNVLTAADKVNLQNGADDVYLHFKSVEVISDVSATTVERHEGRDFMGAAHTAVGYNLNRAHGSAPKTTIKASAGAALSGSAAEVVAPVGVARGSAQGQGTFAGIITKPIERVLAPGVQYTFFFDRAASTAIDYYFHWYEEPKGRP